ncbi:hypothetical protein AXYL_06822 (plasmid) [Achromobacter xylosoxidans A8]|uniref:Uncharacterized protein n=2 Tax=Alcaligenes xylosoxydans xylosoxydans TaxID=85698 RepID=E3HYF0_ACHXA|nr:hypothetical protein AXYL_06822 [Achromobacter xylosoxidans A8]
MALAPPTHSSNMTTEIPGPLSTDQFAALADIARLDSPTVRDAVRRIVLFGALRLDVASELGVGKATVSNAIGRLNGALATARAALPGGRTARCAPGADSAQFEALCHIARLRPQEVVAAQAIAVDGARPEDAATAANCSVATARGAAGRLLAALELAVAATGETNVPRPEYAWASRLLDIALPRLPTR